MLLHALSWIVPASSSLKSQVQLPEVNAETAYKLLPVVSVGVIALGTSCLPFLSFPFLEAFPISFFPYHPPSQSQCQERASFCN